MMSPHRRNRRFRATLDALEARAALSGGLTGWSPEEPPAEVGRSYEQVPGGGKLDPRPTSPGSKPEKPVGISPSPVPAEKTRKQPRLDDQTPQKRTVQDPEEVSDFRGSPLKLSEPKRP
ncbi:hypothetical protein OJF2_14900 [Aquisphaera giovannonii]|uniref:Uncharacterized protein n=1 Tax=Aquisphaera giovannonii TaxID=406548 RepID=A0A5B9VXJ4_9BACT|nr:hypothetical protein [Aquisphaera giovannonii]QEH32998.1 hypothetical protein OJF2_14900 [Aquisphaera giovannonii]